MRSLPTSDGTVRVHVEDGPAMDSASHLGVSYAVSSLQNSDRRV